MGLFAFDVDGTIDADPANFLSIMQALRAAGHRVVILTGCGAPEVTPEDIAQKEDYLGQLGFAAAYDQLVVFADPPAEAKGAWLRQNHADVLFDNSKSNAKASPVLTLVPWKTRTP
jgi:hypothetical protein